MNTTFKAVDGYTTEYQIERVKDESVSCGIVVGVCEGTDKSPCTIIPGHWADRIVSGELLTEEEMLQADTEWLNSDSELGRSDFLVRFIARKLRGEA